MKEQKRPSSIDIEVLTVLTKDAGRGRMSLYVAFSVSLKFSNMNYSVNACII